MEIKVSNNLIKLELNDLGKLNVIDLNCPNLKFFKIYDSKKLTNLEDFLGTCKKLREIKINSYSDFNATLKSIDFINNLDELEYFSTTFKILDGNLKPLLKIKDATICNYYRNYNLKDKELPHEEVLLDENGEVNIVKLSELPKGKEDERIVWMDML